jgi:hypothetical protein
MRNLSVPSGYFRKLNWEIREGRDTRSAVELFGNA